MRLWVKAGPKLAKLGITVPEIISAIQGAGNTVNPAGRRREVRPAPQGPGNSTYSVLAPRARLVSPEEFGRIVVRENTGRRGDRAGPRRGPHRGWVRRTTVSPAA